MTREVQRSRWVSTAILARAGVILAGAVTVQVSGEEKLADHEWRTYGGDLASTRYSPLDQIESSNFNELEIAWQFKTDNLGPRPESRYQSQPGRKLGSR